MILIVSSKEDIASRVVIETLARLGCTDVFRLNLEEAHEQYALTWTADPASGGIRWSLRSRAELDLCITSESISAIYWRRVSAGIDGPMALIPTSANLDQYEIFWSVKWLIESLPAELSPFGHPYACAAADNKHRQMAAALEVGFVLPRSFHSNEMADLRGFIAAQNEVALKALKVSGVTTTGEASDARHIACKAFKPEFLLDFLKGVERCQLFCQEAIQRAHDLRIMVFPAETIVASIDTTNLPENKLDWRESSLEIKHAILPVAPEFDRQLRRYLEIMNLTTGFFDFAQPPDSPPVFFECNTNAEWYWVEWMTGHPIAESIARELMKRSADTTARRGA